MNMQFVASGELSQLTPRGAADYMTKFGFVLVYKGSPLNLKKKGDSDVRMIYLGRPLDIAALFINIDMKTPFCMNK